MNVTTRLLLALSVWISFCFAMVFAIPPKLLLFTFVRFAAYLFVIAGFFIVASKQFENQRFWKAAAISYFGALLFSQMEQFGNPITGYLAEIMCVRNNFEQRSSFPGSRRSGFANIGHWTALYVVIEANLLILYALATGWIWDKFRHKSPYWIAGAWSFVWLLTLGAVTNNSYSNWEEDIGIQLCITTFVAVLLPAVSEFDFLQQPFWPVFTVTSYLTAVHLIIVKSEGEYGALNDAIQDLVPMSYGLVEVGMLPLIPLAAFAVAASVCALNRKSLAATDPTAG